MADETLNIRVKATDETKGALASAESGFKKVGQAAAVANKGVQAGTKKSSEELQRLAQRQKIVNDLFGEFGSKVKVFIAADLAARVVGFTSLMDLLQKAMTAAADSIRDMIDSASDGKFSKFIDSFKDGTPSAEAFADALQKQADAARELANIGGTAIFGLGITGGEEFEFAGFSNVEEKIAAARELSALSKEMAETIQALQATPTTQGFFESLREAILGPGEESISQETARMESHVAVAKERESQMGRLKERYDELLAASRKRAEDDAEAERLTKAAADAEAEWNRRLEVGAKRREDAARKQALLNIATLGQAEALLVLSGVLAKAGTEEEERRANEQARVDRLKAEFDKRAEATTKAIALDRDAKDAAEELDAAYQAARNSALQAHAEIVRAAEDSKDMGLGFSEGTKSAREFFGTLREEGQKLGEQTVFGGFDAMRGFFRDILDGAGDAEEALKNFGRSAIGVAADLLAQFAALRVLDFLFPGLGAGLGVVSNAKGGVHSGGIESFAMGGIPDGGMVTGPRLVAVGDNAERSEAILPLRRGPSGRLGVESAGGGGGSTVNLTVNSLDPRTAADVVLAQMPQIQRALATSLSKGSTRALNLATKGAQL